MPTIQISEVMQRLCRAGLLREAAHLTDRELLENFVGRRDSAALETLVRRHGPMIWGVCRRVLGNYHDAEDAFGATFLVLVRRAASIRTNPGNWLYGVAYQTARKARATRAKRRAREGPREEMPEPAVTEQDPWSDLRPLLDQELSRLPEKYRAVILLCDLEGKSGREAARNLGCPEGTVASRLARARAMLAKRLTRHGLGLSIGALAAVLAQRTASASTPRLVVCSTINGARQLAAGHAAVAGAVSVKAATMTETGIKAMEGVMNAMFMNKLKMGTVLLCLAVIGLGAGMDNFKTAGAQPARTETNKADDKLGNTARAQKANPNNSGNVANLPQKRDSSKQAVAYIYGETCITREEFRDYLIEHYGKDVLELFVNMRIIDAECANHKIGISSTEIDANIVEDCKRMNVNPKDFVNAVLKSRYHKTLNEWRNQVIRPRLSLAKLFEKQVVVSEDELKKMYENRYGANPQAQPVEFAEVRAALYKEVLDRELEKQIPILFKKLHDAAEPKLLLQFPSEEDQLASLCKSSNVAARQMKPDNAAPSATLPQASEGSKQAVALIYGTTAITRQEFGDYLIDIYWKDHLELFINKKIIDMECAKFKIGISPMEIDAAIIEDCKRIRLEPKEFVHSVLKSRYRKSLHEWRADVIRPRLLLAKLCEKQVQVSDDDLKKMYENRYGEKAQVKMIVWPSSARDEAQQAYGQFRAGAALGQAAAEAAWETVAKKQQDANSGRPDGLIEPIGHHHGWLESGKVSAKVEEIAFGLKVGDFSSIITVDGIGHFIVKRTGTLPAAIGVSFENVRAALKKEVLDRELEKQIPILFKKMHDAADPKPLLTAQPNDDQFTGTNKRLR